MWVCSGILKYQEFFILSLKTCFGLFLPTYWFLLKQIFLGRGKKDTQHLQAITAQTQEIPHWRAIQKKTVMEPKYSLVTAKLLATSQIRPWLWRVCLFKASLIFIASWRSTLFMCLGMLIFKQDEIGTARRFQSLLSRQNEPNNHRKLLDTDSTALATVWEWFLVQTETRCEDASRNSQHFLVLWG